MNHRKTTRILKKHFYLNVISFLIFLVSASIILNSTLLSKYSMTSPLSSTPLRLKIQDHLRYQFFLHPWLQTFFYFFSKSSINILAETSNEFLVNFLKKSLTISCSSSISPTISSTRSSIVTRPLYLRIHQPQRHMNFSDLILKVNLVSSLKVMKIESFLIFL